MLGFTERYSSWTSDFSKLYCVGSKTSKTASVPRKEGNVLFNDTLNTFYSWLYGVRLMVKYHTYSERGNLLLSHGLLFPINSKGSFIYTILQT